MVKSLAIILGVGMGAGCLNAPAHGQPDKRRMAMAGCVYIEQHKPDSSRSGMSVAEYCERMVEESCQSRGDC